jgi:hypothetical protein
MAATGPEIREGEGGLYRSRVAVLLEPGRRGAAALAHAAALCRTPASELTVVAVAPTVETVCRSCGGVSPRAYNCAVRDEVAQQLEAAVAGLGPLAEQPHGKLLVEGADPSLEHWIAHQRFDLVLLPSRPGLPHARRHPAVRRLRRCTDVPVKVVAARRT